MDDLESFLLSLGIKPNDISIFQMALTHPSFNNLAKTKHHDYERLEFLGDSLVGFVVASLCYRLHPDLDEGSLTSIKARFVSSEGESAFCKKIGLERFLRINPGVSNTINMRKVQENIFESFIGALLLDQGRDEAIKFLTDLLSDDIKEASPLEAINPKSRLQEALQADFKVAVTYRVIEEKDEAMNPFFVASALFDNHEIGKGEGKSKKEAETKAALDALSRMSR